MQGVLIGGRVCWLVILRARGHHVPITINGKGSLIIEGKDRVSLMS